MNAGDVAPNVFVVFGGTGDLMRRKLLPALHHLARAGHLGERSLVVGVSRNSEMDDQAFREWARRALDEAGLQGRGERGAWRDECLHFQSIGRGEPADYEALADRVRALEEEHGLPGNRTLYLALPPGAFPGTIRGLGEAGLSEAPGWTRLVIEKPFGHDLDSARDLNAVVHQHFHESQVYRIDHYLGKETVQNLLVLRFANALFESMWNRDRIESVQITVAERLGLEGRAGYYDQSGALRDMVQNHLTQLLTLVAMEVPARFAADAIRAEKVKVLQAVSPIGEDDVVVAQYGAGRVDDQDLPAYCSEDGVADDSRTETYVALKLGIDTWRWQGVPFYLRTGKRLPRRTTQIVVHFRRAPVNLFAPFDDCDVHRNVLIVTLQPDEGFDLRFEVKRPGADFALTTQSLDFRYGEAYGDLADAYETLILDVLTGDQTLFVHADEVEASWRLYTPLLERAHVVHAYPSGTWGPAAADELAGAWVMQ